MIFKRLMLLGLLIPACTVMHAGPSHGNQSAEYRNDTSEQMSPGGKFAASVVVGGLVGVVGAEALKKSTEIGGFLGVVAACYALYLLRISREDAVEKAVGPEYVGVSAISALATGMVVYRR